MEGEIEETNPRPQTPDPSTKMYTIKDQQTRIQRKQTKLSSELVRPSIQDTRLSILGTRPFIRDTRPAIPDSTTPCTVDGVWIPEPRALER